MYPDVYTWDIQYFSGDSRTGELETIWGRVLLSSPVTAASKVLYCKAIENCGLWQCWEAI